MCLQFPLRDQCASRNDRVLRAGRVLNDNDVVAALGEHSIVLLPKVGLGDLTDGGQHAQAVEEAAVEVAATQGAQLVALGEVGRDVRGDEVGGEKACVCHCALGLVVEFFDGGEVEEREAGGEEGHEEASRRVSFRSERGL